MNPPEHSYTGFSASIFPGAVQLLITLSDKDSPCCVKGHKAESLLLTANNRNLVAKGIQAPKTQSRPRHGLVVPSSEETKALQVNRADVIVLSAARKT